MHGYQINWRLQQTPKIGGFKKAGIGIICNPTFSLDWGSLCQPHLIIQYFYNPGAQKHPSTYVIRFLYSLNFESLRLCANTKLC